MEEFPFIVTLGSDLIAPYTHILQTLLGHSFTCTEKNIS